MVSSIERIDGIVRKAILKKNCDSFLKAMMLERIQLWDNKWRTTDVSAVRVRMSRNGWWISSVTIEMTACFPDYTNGAAVAGTYTLKFNGRKFRTTVSWSREA
jgi:hypothetical protein